MYELLTILGIVGLLGFGLLVAAAWLTWRRIRRIPRMLAGNPITIDGLLPVWRRIRRIPGMLARNSITIDGLLLDTASLRRLPSNPKTARLAWRISRHQRRLVQCIHSACRSGADLGALPALLPRLEAAGAQLRTALAHPTGSPGASKDLQNQVDRHLATLTDLTDAVADAAVAAAHDQQLARQAEDAALGLRLRTDAYTQLMAASDPTRPFAPFTPATPAAQRS